MPPSTVFIICLSTVNTKPFRCGHAVMIFIRLKPCIVFARIMALATRSCSPSMRQMRTGAKRVLGLSETGQITSKIRGNRDKQGSLTNFSLIGFCLVFIVNAITPSCASLGNHTYSFISVSARNVSAKSTDPRFYFQHLIAHGFAVSATPVFTPRSETQL